MTGLPGMTVGAISLQGVIDAIQSNGAQLGQIIQAIDDLRATLGPTYATGTWTPALAFGGSTAGITYSTQSGTYTQLGREVICRFRLVLTSKGAAAGAATIGGLPFTASSDGTEAGSGGLCPSYSNMSGLTGFPVLQVAASATSAGLFAFGAAASAALDNTNFTGTTVLNGMFQFMAAS